MTYSYTTLWDVTRKVLENLLRPETGFNIVGEAHDGLSALRLVEELKPDLVFLDIELPGLHGLEVAREVHARHPNIKIVLMSAHHQQAQIEDTLRATDAEFILKSQLSISRLRQVCRRMASA